MAESVLVADLQPHDACSVNRNVSDDQEPQPSQLVHHPFYSTKLSSILRKEKLNLSAQTLLRLKYLSRLEQEEPEGLQRIQRRCWYAKMMNTYLVKCINKKIYLKENVLMPYCNTQ